MRDDCHDGPPHLSDPLVRSREMARFARTEVLLNEPAAATLTSLAVHLRLALEHELAGNSAASRTPTAGAETE